MDAHAELLYSKDHEWVKVEGTTAKIGISDYAQNALGDIVYVELPEVDSKVEAGAQVGILESVKAVSEMYCPVAGTVLRVNEELENAPELLNSDPYGQFVLEVELDGELDASELMDGAAYAQYLTTLE